MPRLGGSAALAHLHRGPRLALALRCAIFVACAGCGGRIALEDVGTDGDAGSLPSGADKPPANSLPPAPAWDASVPFVDASADAVIEVSLVLRAPPAEHAR